MGHQTKNLSWPNERIKNNNNAFELLILAGVGEGRRKRALHAFI
jgi:hypothetical protein